MTESQWHASTDPAALLSFLRDEDETPARQGRPLLTDRRLRLYACVCARQVWQHLKDGCRSAVVTAEKFADGEASSEDRGLAFNAADNLRGFQRDWAYAVLRADAVGGVHEAFSNSIDDGWGIADRTLADLLRATFGNPFAQPLPDEYRTELVRGLATAAYEERGRKCEACDGRKKVRDDVPYGELSPCLTCHGTGTIDDGSLDPQRLAILCDALLDDAGLPEAVECPQCMGASADTDHWECTLCRQGAGRVPHPLLAALREPVARYRGFWAIDMLTGMA